MVRKTTRITRRGGRSINRANCTLSASSYGPEIYQMEIAYGFFRFGRYSYDIVEVLESMGSVADCDKSAVLEMAMITREMILLSVKSLQSRDKDAAGQLYKMDDKVDELYRKYLHDAIYPQTNLQKQISEPRCYVSALLILRYLERISDHACYVGDSVYYIVTGTSRPRR